MALNNDRKYYRNFVTSIIHDKGHFNICEAQLNLKTKCHIYIFKRLYEIALNSPTLMALFMIHIGNIAKGWAERPIHYPTFVSQSDGNISSVDIWKLIAQEMMKEEKHQENITGVVLRGLESGQKVIFVVTDSLSCSRI